MKFCYALFLISYQQLLYAMTLGYLLACLATDVEAATQLLLVNYLSALYTTPFVVVMWNLQSEL